jgi:hypothetical protein
MTQSFVSTTLRAANAKTNEHDQANGIAPPSSGDQTATTSTDVATLLLSPQKSEITEVIVQSPPISSPDESTQVLSQGHFWPQQMLWHLKWLHPNLLLPVQAINQVHTSQWLMFLLQYIAWWKICSPSRLPFDSHARGWRKTNGG